MLGPALRGSVAPGGGAPSLLAMLTAAAGEAPTFLGLGPDITLDGSNNVTGWPATTGPNLTNSTANRLLGGTYSGKRAIAGNGNSAKSLVGTLAAPAHQAFAIVDILTLPYSATYYSTYVRWTAVEILTSQLGVSTLFNPGSIYTHFVDGVATDTVTTGLHVLSGSHATGGTDLQVGGYDANATRLLSDLILGVVTFSSALSTAHTQAVSTILRNWASS
jgi:hypothetical protein